MAVLELAALVRSGAHASEAIKHFRVEELSEYEKRQFHLIWQVAQDSGGPLAVALDRLAEVFDNQRRILGELQLTFASPKATANLILLLPIASLLLAELFGIAALGKALETTLGVVALALGSILLIVARLISLRMLARAKPKETDPGIFFDAVVIALSAGLSAKAAARVVQQKHLQCFEEKVPAAQLTILSDAISVSERSGIALSGILVSRADSLRHKLWSANKNKLAKLQISLMLPLGLVALPAFVLLAVVPVGLGLFTAQ